MPTAITSLLSRLAFAVAAWLLAPTALALPPGLPADANTTCPVMTDQDVDPAFYVDYKGRRIYLCCDDCVREVRNDPEKFLAMLPPPKLIVSADVAQTTVAATTVAPTNTGVPAPSAMTLPRVGGYLGRFHPLTLHFPLALMIGAALLEAIAAARKRPPGAEAPRAMLALAALGSLVTVPLGWLNAAFERHPGLDSYVEWHRWTGTAAGAVVVLAWVLSRVASRNAGSTAAYRLVIFGGAILIIVAGHYGAALVHGPDYLVP